tara:strand:- start:322 stop:780 length:459 start_codon:yes stop_codon:yes gene_type:complete
MSDGFQYRPYETLESLSDSVAHSTESIESGITGLKPTDAAWVAGLLDGEACFSFNKTPTIAVESTSPSVIEEMYRIFGGRCSAVTRRTSSGRPVFRWRIYGQDAIRVCRMTHEYLKDKKEQAALLSCMCLYPPKSSMRKSIQRRLGALKRVI